MSKKVVLIGHCGADTSYLRLAVKKAAGDPQILGADDAAELEKMLNTGGIDLILFNRQLDYGFDSDQGVDVIRSVHAKYPNQKMMLVSNYPEAQQAAVAAGALHGFGKRELGTPRVTELLRNSLGMESLKNIAS